MNREIHVRICESLGVKFPRATRLPLFEGSLNVQISNDLLKKLPKKNFYEEAKIIRIMSTNRYRVKIQPCVTKSLR